jgi:hypothetical protein
MTNLAQILTIARRQSGMTAAELDYSLSCKEQRGLTAIGSAIYSQANSGFPQVTAEMDDTEYRQYQARADALHAQLADATAAHIVESSTRKYTGWSTASTEPIRYAN